MVYTLLYLKMQSIRIEEQQTAMSHAAVEQALNLYSRKRKRENAEDEAQKLEDGYLQGFNHIDNLR